jgi:NAD(P)-dependent dehydrogenase (short-subunit alcohol dehydrogenase family)
MPNVIHALSHNAGILRCYLTHEMTPSQWNEVINVNLTGTFNVNRHAIPHLLKNERSYIVNTSSNVVDQTPPWMAAYCASKGAIKAFTRALAIEYSFQGLHANCVLPGNIQTELAAGFRIPEGANPNLVNLIPPPGAIKFVSPDYVAGVVALLMSNEGDHINGTEITIDGGRIF